MITSYTVLLDRLRLYCESQLTIKRFGGEFKSELNNFANENEQFPIVYVTSVSQQIGTNTTQFELDIYCLDLLLDDRSNYGANSDCKLILNDLYNYYEAEYDWDVNVIGTANIYDLNNQLLDTAIGGVMRITLEVANYTSCSIPFKDGPIYFESDSCSTQTFQYLTCDSVTGCTSLQEYIAEQIALVPTGTTITGYTYIASANTLSIELSDNTTFDAIINEMSGMTFTGPVSGTTYYGDGSNLTGINATEVTGFTFNPANYQIDLNQSNDNNFLIDLSILASDMTITGGTYNPSTGTATFTNNSGGTFDVTGFLTGFTDIYTTGATYDNNTGIATFTRNDGQSYSANGFFTGSTSIKVTGFTNNNNIFTIYNSDETTNSTSLNTLTGLTINGILDVDSIQFDTTATTTNAVGKLNWNDTDGTLNLGLKGGNVSLQIGQETVIRVVNKTGSLISNGSVVKVVAVTGGVTGIALAQADSDANSATVLGIATEDIANNQQGFITIQGLVHGLNTNSFTEGDVLYLSPTIAGGLTNVKPIAPQHMVIIGYVAKKNASDGHILLHVQNGYELDELHNVKISGATNGDSLVYNSSTTLWENKTITTLGSITALFDAGAGVISTGSKVVIPGISFNGIITGWQIYETSDTPISSSCVVDVWKDSYANYPPVDADMIFTTRPTLVSAIKNENLSPTFIGDGDTVSIGDTLVFNIDSNTNARKLQIVLRITKS